MRGGIVLILGIDPGLAATGWGLIESVAGRARYVDGGVFRTSAAASNLSRLEDIYRRTAEVARQKAPGLAGVERVFAGAGAGSAVSLGEARGAAVAALFAADIAVAEASALQIKKAVTGSGRADKKQIARMLPFLLDGAPEKLAADAADALACALAVMPSARRERSSVHFRLPRRRRAARR